MVMRLNISSSGEKSRSVELPENADLTIGRSDSSDIVLSDMSVSRRHAILSTSSGECFIEDLASTAGTWLNGEKIISKMRILPGDKLKIGGFELSLSKPEQVAAKPQQGKVGQAPSDGRVPIYDIQTSTEMYSDEMLELARVIQARVLEILNIAGASVNKLPTSAMRPKVEDALDQVLRELRHRIPSGIQIEKFRAVLMDDLIGFGPLSPLLRAPDISEIMINGPDNIFVESKGIQYRTPVRFN